MGKLKLKGGTPLGNRHLCDGCTWGQLVTGYRESDRLAICTNTSPNIVLPFTVCECSSFSDKHRPDWELMEKLAIDIHTTRRSSRTAGFTTAVAVPAVNVANAEADEDEA